jgi:FMN phosphatase YigB (HAD superfamily)
MARRPQVDFLFDVDNTLLDNDAAQADYRAYLERESGADAAARYWAIFLELRQELGYADYLGALQRYRLERLHDPRVLLMSSFLLDYPFADRLYPGALDVIAHCGRVGRSVVVTDGDVVFQPRKVERAGIRRAVQDRVLICLHKERELADVERLYPADHYVFIDDKLRILTAVKEQWGSRVTTIFARQGHYAHDPRVLAAYPAADLSVSCIGDLLDLDPQTLIAGAGTPGAPGGRHETNATTS